MLFGVNLSYRLFVMAANLTYYFIPSMSSAILEKLLEQSRFTKSILKWTFLPRRVGLGSEGGCHKKKIVKKSVDIPADEDEEEVNRMEYIASKRGKRFN